MGADVLCWLMAVSIFFFELQTCAIAVSRLRDFHSSPQAVLCFLVEVLKRKNEGRDTYNACCRCSAGTGKCDSCSSCC